MKRKERRIFGWGREAEEGTGSRMFVRLLNRNGIELYKGRRMHGRKREEKDMLLPATRVIS